MAEANDGDEYGQSDIDAAWEAGELAWNMREYQLPIYEDIKAQLWGSAGYLAPAGKHPKYVLEAHRRLGKGHIIASIACELCRQKQHGRVYWAAETGQQVTKILRSVLRPILDTCPAWLRPTWIKSEGILRWPETEAEFHIAGCEDEMKADRLRGDGADLFVIDEAGSIDILQYVYRSIATWMVADRYGEGRNGKIILPSTPARSPAHPFTAYCFLAESGDGGFMHRDVFDSRWPQHQIDELAKECGGYDSPDWQREGLALRVVDASRAIVHEFTPNEAAIVAPMCLRCGEHFDKHEAERCANGKPFRWAHEFESLDDGTEVDGPPPYRDCYVSADPGDNPSLFALGFGYWNFLRSKLVIEAEWEASKPTTQDVADAVAATEARLWGKHFAQMVTERRTDEAKPYRRVTDLDPRMTNDLPRIHDLYFTATAKDNADDHVNELRLWCKWGKVAIHPRCRRTIAHLKAGIKNKRGTEWEFIEGFGHFDHIAWLVYMVRNVDRARNPWPDVPFGISPRTHWFSPKAPVATVPREYQDLAAAWPTFTPGSGL